MKVTKATAVQGATYHGLYPLHGYMDVPVRGTDEVKACALEDLRASWGRGDPHWELLAPDGFIFSGTGTHSVLGFTQQDLTEVITTLEPDDERPEGLDI